MNRRALVACSLLVSLGLPLSASAQASLVDTLGGTLGYGTSCLGASDDGSSARIDLTPYFPGGLRFFDRTHTSIFVNTNGNVTFGEGQACFTPTPFPIAMQPMIAPYWADVDSRRFVRMRPTGRICSGSADGDVACTVTTVDTCASPTEDGIWYAIEAGRMVVTWDRVGYYQCRDGAARMSFQLILTAVGATCAGGMGGGTDFDVEFRYNRCEWEAGQASGDLNANGLCDATETTCVPAQAGFDAGNRMDFTEIMGSRERGISTALCTGSNQTPAEPGVWRFQIRGGVVITCPEGGMPCTVPGVMGACAMGRLNCIDGTTTTECVQQVTPVAESCDNLDNDCDGETDEVDGGSLCDRFEICQAGACIEGCFEGSCPDGYTCSAEGYCVDASCIGVSCAAEERCVMGSCVQPCAGVTCPHEEQCVGGRCVNPCAGIGCDDCTACVGGTCVPRCSLAGAECPAGETCAVDGRCVETACVGVSCTGGYCAGGSCVDGCTGVTCPFGQICEAGACVSSDRPDASTPRVDGNFGDSAVVFPDAGPAPMDSGPMADAGAPRSRGDCSCRAGGRSGGGGAPWGLGVALAVLFRCRRASWVSRR